MGLGKIRSHLENPEENPNTDWGGGGGLPSPSGGGGPDPAEDTTTDNPQTRPDDPTDYGGDNIHIPVKNSPAENSPGTRHSASDSGDESDAIGDHVDGPGPDANGVENDPIPDNESPPPPDGPPESNPVVRPPRQGTTGTTKGFTPGTGDLGQSPPALVPEAPPMFPTGIAPEPRPAAEPTPPEKAATPRLEKAPPTPTPTTALSPAYTGAAPMPLINGTTPSSDPGFPNWMTADQRLAFQQVGETNRLLSMERLRTGRDPDTGRPLPPPDPFAWLTPLERLGVALGDWARSILEDLVSAPLMAVLPGIGEVGIGADLIETAETAGSLAVPEGSFSITELGWRGYPDYLPQPEGPFRLVEGAEYTQGRAAANMENASLHAANPDLAYWQFHELQPVKFGGSPTDIFNKVPLTPDVHYEVNNFWNAFQRSFTYDPYGFFRK